MFVVIVSIVTFVLNVAIAAYVWQMSHRTDRLLHIVNTKLKEDKHASGFERRLWDLQGQRFGRQMQEEPRKR